MLFPSEFETKMGTSAATADKASVPNSGESGFRGRINRLLFLHSEFLIFQEFLEHLVGIEVNVP